MRLDFNAFMLMKPRTIKARTVNEETKPVNFNQPSKLTIAKVMDVLDGSTAICAEDIVNISGVSQSAVYRSIKVMKENKNIEVVFVPRKGGRGTEYFRLTGADIGNTPEKLITKQFNRMQPNNKSGISGVHYNKEKRKWVCTFGRGVSLYFNNLFDAVCKRKSLELTINQGVS